MIGFVDIETTGLDPNRCKILEVALVFTNDDLEEVDYQSCCIHQEDIVLNSMDDWCQEQHSKSGLIRDVRQKGVPQKEAEKGLVNFFNSTVPEDRKVPMAGNSVHFDRDFLSRHMPDFENCFHYRNIDVSLFKEILNRWDLEERIYESDEIEHRALSDIHSSINQLRHYKKEFFHG